MTSLLWSFLMLWIHLVDAFLVHPQRTGLFFRGSLWTTNPTTSTTKQSSNQNEVDDKLPVTSSPIHTPQQQQQQPMRTSYQSPIADKIKAAGNARRWEEAWSLFQSCSKPGIFEYSAIIQAARFCRQFEEAMRLYDAIVTSLGADQVNVFVYEDLIAMNMDFGEDTTALRLFNNLVKSRDQRKGSKARPITPAGQVILQRCLFNSLRASLNLHFESYSARQEAIQEGRPVPEVVNTLRETIQSIEQCGWSLTAKHKALIVKSYASASWNMTNELPQWETMIFQHPSPDVATLEVYMNAMLLNDCPMHALTALQWYLPLSSRTRSEDISSGMDTPDDPLNKDEMETSTNTEQGTVRAASVNDGSSGVGIPTVNVNGARGAGLTSMGPKQPQLHADPLSLFAAFVPAATGIKRQRMSAADNDNTEDDGSGNIEMISARCLGYAMKAIWRLSVAEDRTGKHQNIDEDDFHDDDAGSDSDFAAGSDDPTVMTSASQASSSQQQMRILDKGAKSEAILYLLRYAEEANDLSAGLVVTAIAACRELTDWQSAYQIYNTAKLAAKEGRFFDVSATVTNTRKNNGEYASGGTSPSERIMPLLQGLSLEKRKGKRGNKLPRPSSLAAIEAAETAAAAAAVSSNNGVGTDAVTVVPPPMVPIQINAGTPVNVISPSRNVSGLQGGQGLARKAVGLPSIVYGQAVVTMAKGGAESQTFQIFCEMLEAGMVPSENTTNNVLMELSRKGSYKVAISILDRLYRYKVPVSKPALNSLFNACDKAGAYDRMIEIFATKRVTASHIDELGLSVLIKSCDRLGDAEWAVMILKEVIKAGLHVKFKYYQRVFAILVKSPNAAQLAVEMLLHIEKNAALNKVKETMLKGGGSKGVSSGVSSRTMGDLAAAAAAADERDQMAAELPSPRTTGWMTTTPVPEGGESERDRYLRELLDTLSNPYADEQKEESLEDELSLSEFYHDGDEITDDDVDVWAPSNLAPPPTSGYTQQNNNNHNRNNEGLRGSVGGVRSSKYEAFADTLRDLLSFETPPMADPCIYAAVISSLSHNRMAKEACALLRSYVSRGGQELEEMYTSTMYAFRYQRNPDAAEAVFRQLQRRSALALSSSSATATATNTLAADVDEAETDGSTVPPLRASTPSYNALLAVYAVSKVLDDRGRGDQLLAEMRVKGLAWDSYTYTALMMGRSDRKEVIRLWEDMVAKGKGEGGESDNGMGGTGILPTQAAAAELFKACELEGAGDVALRALLLLWKLQDDAAAATAAQTTSSSSSATKKMNEAVRRSTSTPVTVSVATPDMVFCTRTLTALSAEGKHQSCLDLLNAMRDRGLSPTAACYAIVMATLERVADWKKAVNLLLQMQTRGVLVDYRAVNSALSACAKSEQWEMVLKLFEQMPTVTSHAFVPNQFSFFQAIQAACKVKDAKKAMNLLRAEAAAGFTPSTLNVAQVLNALEVAERFDDTVAIFEEYVSQHLGIKYYDPPGSGFGLGAEDDVFAQLRERFPALVVSPMVVDLHGYSTPMARAAVRSALRCLWEEARSALNSTPLTANPSGVMGDYGDSVDGDNFSVDVGTFGENDHGSDSDIDREDNNNDGKSSWIPSAFGSLAKRSLIIIVGKGFNSRDFLEPVLKPNLQRWLEEDFSPPLVADEVVDNPGRLFIPGDCIFEWIVQRAVSARINEVLGPSTDAPSSPSP